jgi:hypothetical protein
MTMAGRFHRRWAIASCLAVSLSLLSACTVPATTGATPPVTTTKPPPRMSRPLPPSRVVEAPRIDNTCRTDADCTVKNVGNCCGAMPACVNKDSPVDPAAVQSQCAKDGRMGVCGFRQVSACTCNAGACEAADQGNPLRGPVLRPDGKSR